MDFFINFFGTLSKTKQISDINIRLFAVTGGLELELNETLVRFFTDPSIKALLMECSRLQVFSHEIHDETLFDGNLDILGALKQLKYFYG